MSASISSLQYSCWFSTYEDWGPLQRIFCDQFWTQSLWQSQHNALAMLHRIFHLLASCSFGNLAQSLQTLLPSHKPLFSAHADHKRLPTEVCVLRECRTRVAGAFICLLPVRLIIMLTIQMNELTPIVVAFCTCKSCITHAWYIYINVYKYIHIYSWYIVPYVSTYF